MQLTAIEPYYGVGTATLSTANRNMTGQGGTQWIATVVPGDQVYGADGRMGGVVESVNSNTSITLVNNWRGSNQSAGVYTIFRVSDSVRIEVLSQRLYNLMVASNVSALAELTLANNKGIHATGDGALATHDLTVAARALLGDSTVPRSGAGSGQHRSNGENDARFMQTGAFGLGRAHPLPTGNTAGSPTGPTGLQDIPATSFFTHASSTGPGDAPIGSAQGAGIKIGGATTWNATLWAAIGEVNRWFARSMNSGGVSSSWAEFLMRHSILGTVSQSAGSPTGAIIQRGGNANGEYVRFADGTQICTRYLDLTGVEAVNNAGAGGLFRSILLSWTFPAAFAAGAFPAVAFSTRRASLGSFMTASGYNITTALASFVLWANSSLTVEDQKMVTSIAIGRWF